MSYLPTGRTSHLGDGSMVFCMELHAQAGFERSHEFLKCKFKRRTHLVAGGWDRRVADFHHEAKIPVLQFAALAIRSLIEILSFY